MDKSNQYIDVSSNSDFGFSFTDEKELVRLSKESSHLIDQVVDLKRRLQAVKIIFLPLLKKLNEDPDKELIRWPDREKILNEQIAKLINLTDL